MGVIVHTDLRGIQRFLYQSRRLRDAVARSYLVAQAARRAGGPLAEAVKGTGGSVVSAAGGTSVVACADGPTGRRFATRYSAALLDHCPELDPVTTVIEASDVRQALLEVPDAASARAGTWSGNLAGAGFGFTRASDLGGGAAEVLADIHGDRVYMTASELATRGRLPSAQRDLDDQLLAVLPTPDGHSGLGWRLPVAMEDLGRSEGVRSGIGVLHLDLNALGARRADWLRNIEPTARDEAVIEGIGIIERVVDTTMWGLLAHLVATCVRAVTWANGSWLVDGSPADLRVPLSESDGRINLPLRPVLTGGDDLTVICDARLTWSLARAALHYLSVSPSAELSDLGGGWEAPLTAAIGAAVVNLGFPFDVAYATAAALCERAKARSRAEGASCFDWHIGNTHPAAVATLPDRSGRLTGRPYTVDELDLLLDQYLDPACPGSLRALDAPKGVRPWAQRRSWVRDDLSRAIPAGPQAVKAALDRSLEVHGTLPFPEILPAAANWGEPTLLGDSVELLSWHLHLPILAGPALTGP